jgi:micrococcal nuclease
MPRVELPPQTKVTRLPFFREVLVIVFNTIFIKVISVVIVLLLWGCQVAEKQPKNIAYPAQLVRVISGQTIEVKIPQKEDQSPQQVRLIGVDVPQSDNDAWGEQAKTRLKELLADGIVNLELESEEKDRYQRIFAHVWHNDILVSQQLAQEGYVIANTKYPHHYSDRIFHAQEYARILGYGIWGVARQRSSK